MNQEHVALGRRDRCDCHFLQEYSTNVFWAVALSVVEAEPQLGRAASLMVRYEHHFCLAVGEWGANDELSRKDQFVLRLDYVREHALPLAIRGAEFDARHDSSFGPVVER